MIKCGLSVHPQWINGSLKRLEEELVEIKHAGADCCELVLHALDVVIGGRIVPKRLAAVLRVLKEYKLEYTLHLPYDLNLLCSDTSELHFNTFLAGIEFAKAAEIGLIVYHAGITRSFDESALNKEAKQIKLLAKEADGIYLCMENPPFLEDGLFSPGLNAKNMVDFFKEINLPNFKLTFDIGHSFLGHQGDGTALLNDLRMLLPYIGHIHLHDNFGARTTMCEHDYSQRITLGAADIHLPLGWGGIPVKEVLRHLNEWDGIINLEIEQRFRDQYGESLALVHRDITNGRRL
jgi:sugar phosphate isomerase/epimerase